MVKSTNKQLYDSDSYWSIIKNKGKLFNLPFQSLPRDVYAIPTIESHQ